MMKKTPAVFLDRDGVLNEAVVRDGRPYPPGSVSELVVEDSVRPALERLKEQGYLLIVVTNQPDIARGTTKADSVAAIHDRLRQLLPLDDIYMCPHDDKDDCTCRKPRPGMILDAAKKYGVSLEKSVMVGDRWKDILAGKQAGCKTGWLNRGYAEDKDHMHPDFVGRSLPEIVEWIVSDMNSSN